MDAAAVRKKGKGNLRSRAKARFAWAVLTPTLVYYSVFTLLPMACGIALSFTKWNGLRINEIKWAGFKNFIDYFSQKEYVGMLGNTFLMGALLIAFTMLIGFCVASMLVKVTRGSTVIRTVWYLPTIVSTAVISQIFNALLNPNSGLLNNVIVKLGGKAVLWQSSTFWMFFWIILLQVWKSIGGPMLLFMAGIQQIPVELYEAADIDGVNKWQRLIHITLPSMRNMLTFVLVTSLIGIFSIFEPVQMLSKGGPGTSTMVVMYQIYNEAFLNMNMGMSSAISTVVLIMAFVLTVASMKLSNIKV